MRQVFFAVLLLSLAAMAQNSQPTDTNEIRRQLMQIEEEIARANNTCNYDYFRKIEANEFLFTDSQGTVYTRAEDLAGEKDCKRSDSKHEFDEPKVIVVPGAVVLSARHSISGVRNGSPFRVQTRLTDVFIWRDGRWQIIAGHSSRIPSPKS